MGQDEPTSGAAAGVIQNITAAPEISSDRDFVVNPWTWYYSSTSTPTNVEFHLDADKVAAVAAEGEEKGAMYHLADADVDWSSTGGFFFWILLPSPPPSTPPCQTASMHHRRRFPTH